MRRYAKWKKIQLTDSYWLEPDIQPIYIRQIQKASSLLKVYPYDVIIEALSTDKNLWISSLFVKDIINSCQQIMKKRERLKNAESIEVVITEPEEYKPKPKMNNKVGKLGGMDI